MTVSTADEGTAFWLCSDCKEPCDPQPPTPPALIQSDWQEFYENGNTKINGLEVIINGEVVVFVRKSDSVLKSEIQEVIEEEMLCVSTNDKVRCGHLMRKACETNNEVLAYILHKLLK
jgi:hypothetical protein